MTGKGAVGMGRRFEGKVALVTGGGSGIGRAVALLFSGEGARCIVDDLSAENGMETVRLIKDAGGDAIFVRADVSKASEVKALIDKAVETYGRLDCAVNAAYFNKACPMADLSEESWDQMIDVCLKGAWLCMKYEILQMAKQGGGAIVNVSAVAALKVIPGVSAYSAAKAGIAQLTRVAAFEYGKAGMRINAVAPGYTRTPGILKPLGALEHGLENAEKVISGTPVGRWGEPAELAEAIVWLCSDAASFVTGTHMIVDGGFTCM
jgi:NAD(P)-dependent dehydrogenase (short-subunit alcohol dehydrogenase family)